MIAESGKAEEPKAAELPAVSTCSNCGYPAELAYCPKCGQRNTDFNASLWQFVNEFLEEFLRFDSKLIRTLIPLLTRPGRLTREWIEGKRARYVSPLKLYLTLSAICFLLISFKPNSTVIHVGGTPAEQAQADSALEKLSTKSESAFENMVNDQVRVLVQKGPAGDMARKEFNDKFVGRLSTATLLMLPVFALYFKILYARRSRFYVEHLVFALHYCSFAALALSLTLLIPVTGVVILILLWMVAYLPIAMYTNYRQGVLKTFFKFAIFSAVYMVTVSMVLFGMVLLTAHEIRPQTADSALQTGTNIKPSHSTTK